MKKSKIVALALAGTLTATAMLAGTYAWTAISQQARNENQAKLNPGARLHDDYNGTHGIKRVYVENYNDAVKDGDSPILVRVRLDEYMEIGTAAGMKDTATGAIKNLTTVIPSGGLLTDEGTWETYVPKVTTDTSGNYVWVDNPTSDFREYIDLTFGITEDVYYMPTFNKDHDSLAVDVNGTYVGTDGAYDTGTPFDDYKVWADGNTFSDYEVYDGDDDDIPDNGGAYQSDSTIVHTAAKIEKEKSVVISIDQWVAEGSKQLGDFWIYDTTDGWAYWANPLYPGKVTGLLLSGNSLGATPTDDWYYAMNVVGQFATVDAVGDAQSGTGFYKASEGASPSTEAEKLLDMLTSMTEKSMQVEVASGQEVEIVFKDGGTADAGTVAIVMEELASATGDTAISADASILEVTDVNGGVVTVKGKKPGVGTVIYTAANGEVSVARVTVDYAVYKVTASNLTECEQKDIIDYADGGKTQLTVSGYYTDETENVWYQVAVDDYAFDGINGDPGLVSVVMEDGVVSIGEKAFRDCAVLETVVVPGTVSSIGDAAFLRNRALNDVTLEDGASGWKGNTFVGCTSLEHIVIPKSFETIANRTFYGVTTLTNVVMEDGLTGIGEEAFSGCTGLNTIEFPNTLLSIGKNGFAGCTGLTSVTLPDSVTTLGERALYKCTNLASIELSENLTSIGDLCFYQDSFTSIHIPENVKDIKAGAFGRQTKLTTITVAADNEYLCVADGGALYSKDMTRIIAYPLGSTNTTFTIPETVTDLGYALFFNANNLEEITILGPVTHLPYATFDASTKIKTITLPASVSSLANTAFDRLNSLETINFGGTIDQWTALINSTTNEQNLSILQNPNITVKCLNGDFVYGQTGEATE